MSSEHPRLLKVRLAGGPEEGGSRPSSPAGVPASRILPRHAPVAPWSGTVGLLEGHTPGGRLAGNGSGQHPSIANGGRMPGANGTPGPNGAPGRKGSPGPDGALNRDGMGILEAARQEAARIVEEARLAAQRVEAEAAARAEALRKQSHEDARKEGFEAGRRQALKEAAALLEELRRLVGEARDARVRTLALAQEDVLKLALAAAEGIIERRLEAGEAASITRRVLESVLRLMPPPGGELRVRVHPGEYPELKAALEAGRLPAELGRDLELVEDPSVGPAGCVFEGETGRIDARLETRLVEVGEALLGLMRRSS